MNEFMVLYVIINNTKGLLFVMDNTKKENRYTWQICGAIVLIVSIFFCYLCYKYSIIACGIIIVTSVVLINIMLWLLEIRNIKLEEEAIEFIRGDIEKQSHCQIETDFGVFNTGVLICYDNGITYEEDDIEMLDFISYDKVKLVTLSDDELVIQYDKYNEDANCYITSDNSLRLKSIFQVLSKHDIHVVDNTL